MTILEQEPTLELRHLVLRWPAIYAPMSSGRSQLPERYNASFAATPELIEQLGMHGIAPRFNRKLEALLFHASSGISPTVTPHDADFDSLIRAVQIADARNMPRDKLLRGQSVDLRVRFYDYAFTDRKGRGVSVVEVIVDAQAMLRVATDMKGEHNDHT